MIKDDFSRMERVEHNTNFRHNVMNGNFIKNF